MRMRCAVRIDEQAAHSTIECRAFGTLRAMTQRTLAAILAFQAIRALDAALSGRRVRSLVWRQYLSRRRKTPARGPLPEAGRVPTRRWCPPWSVRASDRPRAEGRGGAAAIISDITVCPPIPENALADSRGDAEKVGAAPGNDEPEGTMRIRRQSFIDPDQHIEYFALLGEQLRACASRTSNTRSSASNPRTPSRIGCRKRGAGRRPSRTRSPQNARTATRSLSGTSGTADCTGPNPRPRARRDDDAPRVHHGLSNRPSDDRPSGYPLGIASRSSVMGWPNGSSE